MKLPDYSHKNRTRNRLAGWPEVGAYCDRLPGFVNFWLDPRLRGKLNVNEVAAEIRGVIARHFDRYAVAPGPATLFVARGLALRTLRRIHREYLGDQWDQPGKLAVLRLPNLPRASAQQIARRLWRRWRPDPACVLSQDQLNIQKAFNELPIKDRQILAMRHFERLSNEEIAQTLGIAETAASVRYWQALQKLLPKGLDISA